MKRWLCTLVVFVLSMCAFGMTALAEGEPVSMTVGETTTGYETVAAAVAAAPKDGTQAVITLNENFTGAGVKVSEGQNIVFDYLAGYGYGWFHRYGNQRIAAAQGFDG